MRPRHVVRTAALAAAASSTLVAANLPAPAADLPVVTPASETPAVFDDEDGGNANADDPAIWRNAARPGRSLVIATVKEGGLRVFDLNAHQVQSIPAPRPRTNDDAPGRFNNVDLVSGLTLPTGRADVAVVSDRGNDRLRIYRIDPSRPGGPLTDITSPSAAPVFSADQSEINEQRTAYGIATWKDRATGRSYALVSRRNETRIALLELRPAADGTVGYRKIRTLDLPGTFRLPNGASWAPCGEPGEFPQVEGMVVDPANGMLYAGQEDVGIWRLRADLTAASTLVDKVKEYGVPGVYDESTEECTFGTDPGYGGERLAADVEGLTLLEGSDGDGYLFASSQGDDTFALYSRETEDGNAYEGGFRVVAADTVLDGSEECDGAAVLDAPLGRLYPRGLLVLQDGHDTPAVTDGQGRERESTGFKFVDLGTVLERVDP
ncbi:3-phytase [Streptomyces sp. V3I8]|uniref:phytase n=1 Tax=Streptomyces sp. V3I8 TaxID=3042279 RepID=UPI00278584C6|nr:phytase [Streptomyces sp. V3I8]MDQ1041186.1 3-phytase [Streptomyces sp. V3I8]